jgi:ADP-ribose pyrophosphatase YjhB (NUDIX family)
MPHIHTKVGEIDFVVDVFVVCGDKVLYRFHDKVHKWLVPGGHVELHEVPEQAALREVFEEVGLEVELYNPNKQKLVTREMDSATVGAKEYRELLPPIAMNIHPLQEGEHRHTSLIYFAKAQHMETKEPEGIERSGGLIWLTKEELMEHKEISDLMKEYGQKALELLNS